MKRHSAATVVLLAGWLLAGCHKNAFPQKTSSRDNPTQKTGIEISGGKPETNAVIISRDLGTVTLTNRYETCVQLGDGKACLLTPKMIDSRSMQLTLAVETKSPKGKIHDLSITQVVTRPGQPFEVAVGDFSFSLTPNVISD